MRKILALVLCLLLFCSCASSSEKKTVNETLTSYFLALNKGDYASANALVVQADKNIKAEIEANSVNDYIFKDVSFEVWKIYVEQEYLCADIVVRQYNLSKAYTDTITEYGQYLEDATAQNKEFNDSALEQYWNSFFYKHVTKIEEKNSFHCTIKIQAGETPKILMTAQFRNALFGGELDAINALNQLSKEEK